MMRALDGSTPEGSFAGVRLRLYRRRTKVAAEVLAEDLGVSRAALYRFERGGVVKIDTLRRIADVLGLTIVQVIAPLSAAERDQAVQSLIDDAGVILHADGVLEAAD